VSYDPDKLYNLLPAIHRIRDVEQGEELRQLLNLITEQVGVLEEDLDQLYDNQFIETCAPWVLPYIGDLIGYRSLHPIGPDQLTPRAEVANTIGYRRRKGTASVLEQLARDVTGWNARAVEFFQLLGWTQFMNHLRLTNYYAPDLREWEPLERLGSAFETSAHTVDVRHVTRGEGKYNLPNIGIFLWRLNAFRLHRSPVLRINDHRYLFNPLGANMPLFTHPETEKSITHLAEPINVPAPISRWVLKGPEDGALEEQFHPSDVYYGEERSIRLEKLVNGMFQDIPATDILVANLSDTDDGGGNIIWAHEAFGLNHDKVLIDPELGRIFFPAAAPSDPVFASFYHGFSAAMGGGEYERTPTFDAALGPIEAVAAPGLIQPALDARVDGGVVELSDSGRFEETFSIALNPGVRLEFRAANEHRPTLIVSGPIDIHGGENAEVTLNGLLIAGGPVRVLSGAGNQLRKLRLVHCTLVPGLSLGIDGTPTSPGAPSLLIEQTDNPLEIEIDHCIIGAVRAPINATILVRHSILDANGETHVAYAALDDVGAGGTLSVINSTIIGNVHTELLKLASNSIFLSRAEGDSVPVRSERRQTGCVRFSWLPLEARVPRRYRCQPDLEIAEQIETATKQAGGPLSATERAMITDSVVAQIVPAFTSLDYGQPGYGQLRISAPEQIRTGADDEAEMGAFHDLFQPQRESNLRTRLDEYLRFGLEAGVFYET
jgi:hypothetical protein